MATSTYNPNPIDQTSHAVFVPEVWSDQTIDFRKSKLVMANNVQRWDSEVKAFGDTIHIGEIAEGSAQDVTSGNELTFSKPTATEKTIVVDQWKAYAISRVDILKVQSKIDLMKKYTKVAGYALGKAVDTYLHTLVKNATLTTSDIDAGASVVDENVVNAITQLDIADVPDEGRFWVFHPRAFGDLRKLEKYSEYVATGKAGLAAGGNNGMLYEVYGIPTLRSTNTATLTTPDPDQDQNLLFHMDGIGLAMQKDVTYETDRNIHYLADELVASEIFGGKVLRADHIVRLLRDQA